MPAFLEGGGQGVGGDLRAKGQVMGNPDHAFLLVPAQDYVGQFLATFQEFPPRQKAASFNLDDVMRKLQENFGSR